MARRLGGAAAPHGVDPEIARRAQHQITRIKTYMHSPELLAEVCKELGETFRSNGYRNWEILTPPP